MDLLIKIAEGKINEAIEAGEFDNLPCAGQKVDLNEYFSMPPHLRAAFQLLKNANIVPAEVSILKEINKLEAQLNQTAESELKRKLRQEIQFKRIELRIVLEKYRK